MPSQLPYRARDSRQQDYGQDGPVEVDAVTKGKGKEKARSSPTLATVGKGRSGGSHCLTTARNATD
eukprot:11216171-Lingulodinium_polyedra.AAC.1